MLTSLNTTPPLKPIAMGLLIFSSILMVGYFDLITGPEIHFFLFYMIPISVTTWFYQKNSGYASAFFSIIIWFLVNKTTSNYSIYWYGYWNGLIRLTTFCSFVWFISQIRYFVENEIRLREKIEFSFKELQNKSEHIEELQKQMQTVCAWTHRIKDQGKWISFEEYLAKHFKMQFSHGISEEAVKQILIETGTENPSPIKSSR